MALSATDFDFVRRLVRQVAGIALEDDKGYLVEARLCGLAQRRGYGSPADLLAGLRAGAGDGLRQQVVEAMTTNETSFFRDVHPFEGLRQVVLPELIRRRSAERRLHVWCGACSTGQEPYSLAMLLREHFPALAGWDVRIRGTDLSAEVLERARQGRYTQAEVNRGLPARLLVKYFRKDGPDWRLNDEIRSAVEFAPLNLVGAWPALPPLDLVLLRNVLIYFDVAAKKEILARVRRVLRPDGYLFLGGAETTLNVDDAYERVALPRSSCYRPAAAPARSAALAPAG